MEEWKIKRPLLLLLAVIVLGELAVMCWGRSDDSDTVPLPGTAVTGVVRRIEEKEYGWQVLLACQPNRKILVSFGEFPRVTIGMTIQATGKWQAFSPASNPGQFDAASYYHAQNIRYRLNVSDYRVLKTPRFSYRQRLAEFKKMLEERLAGLAVGEDAQTLSALLLGDRSAMDTKEKTLYQEAGIAHILAVSGLHVSLVGMTLFTALRRIGTPYGIAAVVSGFLVISFCILSESGVSAFRAAAMYVAFAAAGATGRSYDMASAMALAAVLILLHTPEQLSQAGFWLSFGAVFALSLVCPCYQKPEEDRKWKNHLRTMVILQLMLLPLTLTFFYRYPLYSIFLNLMVVPLLTPLFVCTTAGLFGGRLFFWPVHGILWLYDILAAVSLRLPASVIAVGKPSPVRLWIYYAGYFTAAWFQKRKKKRLAYGLLAGCLVTLFCPVPSKELTVTVLNVGQGDGILLESFDGALFIDGGSSDVRDVGAYRLLPCLQSKGIRRLRAVILTHPDSDHYNGMLEVMESGKVRIDRLMLPDADGLEADWSAVLKTAEKQNIPVERVTQGDVLRLGKISLTCLNPNGGNYKEKSNEASLVFWLQYGTFDMLFTGDAEGGAEADVQAAIRKYGLHHRSLEVLKVAHHGSDSSTSAEFLALTAPKAAVLSYGEGNSYGHPHREVMERLTENGCRIYETAREGAVIIRTKGEKFDISGYMEK